MQFKQASSIQMFKISHLNYSIIFFPGHLKNTILSHSYSTKIILCFCHLTMSALFPYFHYLPFSAYLPALITTYTCLHHQFFFKFPFQAFYIATCLLCCSSLSVKPQKATKPTFDFETSNTVSSFY